MKIKKREFQETEIELQLPAFFKHEDDYYYYYSVEEGGISYGRADRVRLDPEWIGINIGLSSIALDGGYNNGVQIDEREYLEAIARYEHLSATLCSNLVKKIQTVTV